MVTDTHNIILHLLIFICDCTTKHIGFAGNPASFESSIPNRAGHLQYTHHTTLTGGVTV